MKRNASRMTELAVVRGSTRNHLMGTWLSHYLNGTFVEDAVADFNASVFELEHRAFQLADASTADWSGTHLTLVSLYGRLVLAERAPLYDVQNGVRIDAGASIRKGVRRMQRDFTRFRMGLWSVLFAAPHILGTPTPRRIDVLRRRWTFYFRAPDIEVAAENAKRAGGKVHAGPMDVPGGERTLVASDPHGVPFGIVAPVASG